MVIVELPPFPHHNISQLIEYLVGKMSWKRRPIGGNRIEVICSVFAKISCNIVGYCVLDAFLRVNKGIWQEEFQNIDFMPLKIHFLLKITKYDYRYSSSKKIVEKLVNFIHKRALFAQKRIIQCWQPLSEKVIVDGLFEHLHGSLECSQLLPQILELIFKNFF